MITTSTNIPSADRPRWTSPDPMHQPPTTANAASTTASAPIPPPSTPTTMTPTFNTVASNPCAPPPSIPGTSIISAIITAATMNTTPSITPAIDGNPPDASSTTTLSIITPPSAKWTRN
nr:unnamed protein product [Spirometra erinaceieuropaei]